MDAVDDRPKNWRIAAACCASAVVLMLVAAALPDIELFTGRPRDHLSVHLLLEMFAIIVSVMVVSVAWSTFSKSGEVTGKALVYGFTVVAGADMLHAIAYEGMPSLVVEGSTREAVFFWLSGRSFEVLTVLLLALQVRLPGPTKAWFGLALLTLAGLFYLGTFHLERLPITFVPGVGVTPFKVHYEYTLCVLNLLLAAWLFIKSRSEKHPRNIWLATACFIMGIGELAFTSYVATSDFLNVFGHLYKVAAYAFIYQAIFLIGVKQPYELLARSEQKIRAQQAELNALLNNLPIGVARLDQALRYRYANPALAASLGQPLERMLGAGALDLIPPSLGQQALPPLNAALAGQRVAIDIEYCAANGQRRFAYAVAIPDEPDEQGEHGVLAIFTDTTGRRQARRQLAESMREIGKLKAALDAHAIVAITDVRGVITRVNDKFCELSQYPREELIGRTHSLINSGHHPREFFQELWRTISRGAVWNDEVCNRAKDGSLYWVQTTIVPLTNAESVPEQYIAIRADITKRKLAEQEAQRMAFHDALTGLPNRRLMGDRLGQALASAERECCYGALLLMDLDHFKEINDTLGHAQGDELLRQASARLMHSVRKNDTVARLGGDEFVVILPGLGSDREEATAHTADLGEKIRRTLALPYELQGQLFSSTPSIGVVLFHGTADTPDELIKQADMALYKAKSAGRNRLCFFDPSLQADITARAQLQRELRAALDNHELQLYYQPIISAECQVLGVEALIRWNHPQRGMVSPATFIPLAEQTGLILPIGQWVLESACNQLRDWALHPLRRQWSIAVNVSAKQLNETAFVANVETTLARSGASASLLRMELTESMLHDNLDETIAKMTHLRHLGVRFSLDDFGTGYSSLSYLKRLPLDQLKIDKSFVDDVLTDPNDAAIARTIIALAAILDLGVVAEGVETIEQRDFLRTYGCQAFQGYLFGRPMPVEQLIERLAHRAETT